MKVITIGSDRKLFDVHSAVHLRNMEYASGMEELHIVVFSLKSHNLTEVKNKNLHIYPTNSSSRYGYVLDAYRLGKKIIPQNSFVRGDSVISSQDPFEAGLVGHFLSGAFRLPLQLQLHTDIFSPFFTNSFLNKVRMRIASFVIPRAQGIRVVSKRLAELIQKKFNLKYLPDVLSVRVDVSALETKPISSDVRLRYPQFSFIVFMASRLTPEKNIETGLAAFKRFLVEVPQAGLLIAGEGPERKFLEKYAQKLGIEKSVVFLGWQEDLVPYYKSSNVYLLTSVFEGYGMTLIEAAACGTPIVTTCVGIADGLCTDGLNSFVCPVENVECFVHGLKELASNNGLRDLFKFKMRDSIQSVVTKPEEYSRQYVGFLENIKQTIK